MKGLELSGKEKHILVVEEGDRLIHLTNEQVAIVLSDKVEEGEEPKLQFSIHFPDVDPEDPATSTMLVAASIREFLADEEWVNEANRRIAERNMVTTEPQEADAT